MVKFVVPTANFIDTEQMVLLKRVKSFKSRIEFQPRSYEQSEVNLRVLLGAVGIKQLRNCECNGVLKGHSDNTSPDYTKNNAAIAY
jgi:hypothetical protein